MNIYRAASLCCLLISASLMSCGKTIVVNDLRVWEEDWRKAEVELRRRAAFEMPCTESAIQLILLQAQSGSSPGPTVVGATGCNKRLTYVARPTPGSNDITWVQDSSTQLGGPAPAATSAQ